MEETIIDYIVDKVDETNEYTLNAITETGNIMTVASWNDNTENVDITDNLSTSQVINFLDILVEKEDKYKLENDIEIKIKLIEIISKLNSIQSRKILGEEIKEEKENEEKKQIEAIKEDLRERDFLKMLRLNDKEIEEKINSRNEIRVIKYNSSSELKMQLPAVVDKSISKNSILGTYTTDMTEINYKTNPAVEREDEIKNIIVSIANSSAVLIGEPGVGKTAVVEGLAYKMQNNDVPTFLQNKKLLKVSAADLVSGCRYVGMIEERVKGLVNEVLERDDIILFFDEIHTVLGTGRGSKSTLDIANILKPYIDRGQIKIIGATTSKEYNDYFEQDGAFKRRFDKIIVKEPDVTKLKNVIENSLDYLELCTDIYFNEEELNKDELINALIKLTLPNNRKGDEYQYNPALVMSILKKAFGFAKYYDNSYLTFNDLKESIENNNYIIEDAKEKFIEKKEKIETKTKNKQSAKILLFRR